MSLAQKVQQVWGLLQKQAANLRDFESFAKVQAQRPVQACFQATSLAHFERGDSLAGAELRLIL